MALNFAELSAGNLYTLQACVSTNTENPVLAAAIFWAPQVMSTKHALQKCRIHRERLLGASGK